MNTIDEYNRAKLIINNINVDNHSLNARPMKMSKRKFNRKIKMTMD